MGDSVESVGKSIGSGVSSIGSAAGKAKVPALIGTAAAASIAGGIALGSRVVPGRRTPLGRLARNGVVKAVAREAGNIGREVRKQGLDVGVGDLTMEVHRRDRGNHQRRSPIEVLLQSLTTRRPKG